MWWCPAIYFYLGNSYDNMYRPARKGEPANDALMQKAVDNYKLASEKLTEESTPRRSWPSISSLPRMVQTNSPIRRRPSQW